MHQPSYRAADGQYRQPWVYLHAIKDYADMAWHLEHAPGARATVSFAPVLVEQLDDYRAQFESGEFRDPLLRDLQRGDADTPERRRRLCYEVCRANFERMVRRYPAYERVLPSCRVRGVGRRAVISVRHGGCTGLVPPRVGGRGREALRRAGAAADRQGARLRRRRPRDAVARHRRAGRRRSRSLSAARRSKGASNWRPRRTRIRSCRC